MEISNISALEFKKGILVCSTHWGIIFLKLFCGLNCDSQPQHIYVLEVLSVIFPWDDYVWRLVFKKVIKVKP